jgi:hypothetical protein
MNTALREDASDGFVRLGAARTGVLAEIKSARESPRPLHFRADDVKVAARGRRTKGAGHRVRGATADMGVSRKKEFGLLGSRAETRRTT